VNASIATPRRRSSRLGPVGLAIYNLFYWPYLVITCALLFVPALALFC